MLEPMEVGIIIELKKKFRADMNNYADDVASGQCSDFAGYQKLCGVIQGLAIAERHLLDLAERLEKSNEQEITGS